MDRATYYAEVQKAIEKHFPSVGLYRWQDSEWQELLSDMYDQFASYTPKQQEHLINSAGPKEPFWNRVVMDAAFAYYMF